MLTNQHFSARWSGKPLHAHFPASLVLLCLLLINSVCGAPFEQIIQTNRPGHMVTKENQVDYLTPTNPPVAAPLNQFLDFGDGLHTLAFGRATVRLTDWSQLYLKDHSRLEIIRRTGTTNSPDIHLGEGEMYFTSREPKGESVQVETPQARGDPKGTEFLVRVDVAAQRTEFIMFDGEVTLTDGTTSVTVSNRHQATVIPGKGIVVRPILEAQNIVQWWIYYPAVIDLDELALSPAEQTQLAGSLTAYRAGNLLRALDQYPDPSPSEPATDAQRTYHAALLLAVGAVDRAEAQLANVRSNAPLARALRIMISAVRDDFGARQGEDAAEPSDTGLRLRTSSTTSSSELLALSYAHQSRHDLKAGLAAARAAVKRSTNFAFGWARVAELEFGHGHTRAAKIAVERALALAPHNAQAHAVQGFLLAAEYRFRDAIAAFDKAISLDPALGNAWLGRGLCKRRLGIFEPRETRNSELANPTSWLSDLQTAAILEPRRSLVRSYAGKAFSDAGDSRLALKEFNYAKELDSNDPTPWLYSALEKWQENRINEAAEDLEKSISLNDNRALIRSRLMLDQDLAVRNASLARIYQDAGLAEVSLTEASKSVAYDYANFSAHQFLAESFNALRDPSRFNLRYETPWFNELLLANVLSPVGAGVLSQNISQQEYSRLFSANGLSLFSATEVRSDGQVRETATQSGLLGRFAYSLDFDYQHNDGVRPNNDLDRFEWYGQFKQQLTDRDSLFVLLKCMDYQAGDNFQHYDPASASRTLRVTETQAPIALATLHREWQPGIHTSLLAGRLQSDVGGQGEAAALDFWTNNPPPGINWVRLQSFDTLKGDSRFTAWVGELNQVFQTDRQITILGGRFQAGDVSTSAVLDESSSPFVAGYYGTPVSTAMDGSFERWSLYAYHTHELWPGFRLTGGVAYDAVNYPANFRFPPVSDERASVYQLSPKAALQWQLHPRVSLRGMYAQSVGGLSYDESVRLEPTQLAGFSQAFRSVISEAEVGSVMVPRYDVAGLALDWKLPTKTFLGVQAQWIQSQVDQTVGIFRSDGDLPPPPRAVTSSTAEQLKYEERSLGFWASQLLGTEWSLGASYRLTDSQLNWFYPEVPGDLPLNPSRDEQALLHLFGARLQYQHQCGFFARAEAHWFIQHNDGYGQPPYTAPRPNDSTTRLDLVAGYRFLRRHAELSVGCLNVLGEDYRLNSLTPYADLPRERVWSFRLKFQF